MPPQKKQSPKDKPLTSVMEDYLEAIYNLDKQKKVVRVKDIAKKMDVKMPTVSSMLKSLGQRGLVNYEKYEYVELTRSGSQIGKEMHRRHGILRSFLEDILKIEPAVADAEACQMEHALSPGTLDSLTDFMAFIQICPRAGESWLNSFESFRQHGEVAENCNARMGDFLCGQKDRIQTGCETAADADAPEDD